MYIIYGKRYGKKIVVKRKFPYELGENDNVILPFDSEDYKSDTIRSIKLYKNN